MKYIYIRSGVIIKVHVILQNEGCRVVKVFYINTISKGFNSNRVVLY